MRNFEQYITEELGEDPISFTGRLGQNVAGVRQMQSRLQKPLEQVRDTDRIVYLANFIASVYSKLPPEERATTFNKESRYVFQQALKAMQV